MTLRIAALMLGLSLISFASTAFADDTISANNHPRYIPPSCDTVPVYAATCGDRQHQILREKPVAELSRNEFEQYVWNETRCQEARDRAESEAKNCRAIHASAKARYEADLKAWQAITPEERRKKHDNYMKLTYVSAGLTVASAVMYFTLDRRCDELRVVSESDPTGEGDCSERLSKARNAYGLFSLATLLTAGISWSVAKSHQPLNYSAAYQSRK